jgi:hypothetical protein
MRERDNRRLDNALDGTHVVYCCYNSDFLEVSFVQILHKAQSATLI